VTPHVIVGQRPNGLLGDYYPPWTAGKIEWAAKLKTFLLILLINFLPPKEVRAAKAW
jgi:hypothetical protein